MPLHISLKKSRNRRSRLLGLFRSLCCSPTLPASCSTLSYASAWVIQQIFLQAHSPNQLPRFSTTALARVVVFSLPWLDSLSSSLFALQLWLVSSISSKLLCFC